MLLVLIVATLYVVSDVTTIRHIHAFRTVSTICSSRTIAATFRFDKCSSKLLVIPLPQQPPQELQIEETEETIHTVPLTCVDTTSTTNTTTTPYHNDRNNPIIDINVETELGMSRHFETWMGCIALITGTTIGAGILALPTVTYTSGFVTSTIALLYGYIIMTISGLYIAELTIRIAAQPQPPPLLPPPPPTLLPWISSVTSQNDGNVNALVSNEQHLLAPSSATTTSSTTKSSSSSSSTTTSLGLLDLYNQGMMQHMTDASNHGPQSPTAQRYLVQYGSTIAYFFLHYAMMVAYIAQGGTNTMSVLFPNQQSGDHTIGPIVFTAIMAVSIYTIPKRIMSMMNNILVIGVFLSMGSIVCAGISTINPNTLIHIQPSYQNPMNVVSSLPIIFLAFVYHNIVPFVVKELQYNVTSIQTAIILGTSLPFLMFVTWNAIVLGNIDPATILSMGSQFDPISVFMNHNSGSGANGSTWLGFSITTFSTLAVITSLIGFTYGLNEAWNDVFSMTTNNKNTINQSATTDVQIDRRSSLDTNIAQSTALDTPTSPPQNALVYALIFIPPLLIALYNPNIFVPALDYGGTFGVTILFLLLPTYILWNMRYAVGTSIDHQTSTTEEIAEATIVPGGKIPMIGLWITAIGLLMDQMIETFDIHFIIPA